MLKNPGLTILDRLRMLLLSPISKSVPAQENIIGTLRQAGRINGIDFLVLIHGISLGLWWKMVVGIWLVTN